jgi:hypothetical protein
VVWVETRWALESEDDRGELAAILDSSASEASSLARAAWSAIAATLAGEPADPPTSTTPTEGPGLLGELADAGFLGVEPLDDADPAISDLAGTGVRLVVVTGAEADDALEPLLTGVVDSAVASGLPTVAAEVHADQEDGPDRGEVLTEALDEELRGRVVLVDHGDLVAGRVAAVLALDAIADGVTGHFGYGQGADAIVPPWSPP